LTRMGKESSQVIGYSGKDVFDREESRQIEEGEREVLKTGKISESTFSREKRIIKTVQFPVRDEQGNISGTGGYREDITNLTASLQALHQERETLEVLLDTMPFCIFFSDRHHRYIRVNRMMAKLLRVSGSKEASGKTNKDFFMLFYVMVMPW